MLNDFRWESVPFVHYWSIHALNCRRMAFNLSVPCRLLPLAKLAPDIVETILDGHQHPGLTLNKLCDLAPENWSKQHQSLAAQSYNWVKVGPLVSSLHTSTLVIGNAPFPGFCDYNPPYTLTNQSSKSLRPARNRAKWTSKVAVGELLRKCLNAALQRSTLSKW